MNFVKIKDQKNLVTIKRKKTYNNIEIIKNNKIYSIFEALVLLKKISKTKFDETVDIVFNLNINSKTNYQSINGIFYLPKGTGKIYKILVLTKNKQYTIKETGADFIGGEELIEKIEKNKWLDFDIIIATPDIINELKRISKILGPKKLMPSINCGTITSDLIKTIQEIKQQGKINFYCDKNGSIHSILGKLSFTTEDLKENYNYMYESICKNNILISKKIYIKNIFISSTMGVGLKIKY